ncbi:MAG: response regulator transcription factor [Sphingomonadaceae bacterium]|nr:response regulator transcription factor [Sphingomonadaceae bacterium]
MRILIVEQDPARGRQWSADLSTAAHDTVNVMGPDAGYARARYNEFDLILADVGGPASVSDFVQRLRLAKNRTPVLLLSPTDRLVEVVRALSAGADDYVTLPIARADLLARVDEFARVAGARSRQFVRLGKLAIDLERRRLEVNGERVHLTGKEFQMLELLALKKGTTVTKEMFLDHLYGGAYEPVLKIIDVFICKLRKKLMAAAGENYIETIWGRGYIMRDPAEHIPSVRSRLSA